LEVLTHFANHYYTTVTLKILLCTLCKSL